MSLWALLEGIWIRAETVNIKMLLLVWLVVNKTLKFRLTSFLILLTGVWHLQIADCRPQTADCRPQTAYCRLQTAGCRLQIADCKLNDTKNLPNKGDVIKKITSSESEKVAWEQGWYFCAKLHWPHSQDAVGYSSPTLYQLTRHITNCVDSLFFFDYCELIMTSSNAH